MANLVNPLKMSSRSHAPQAKSVARRGQVAPAEVTELLQAWSSGDKTVQEQLLNAVYQELKRIASGMMKDERRDHTLQPTALVHEAYLRMVDQRRVSWQNRTQFFSIAARMMRRVLVNHAVSRNRDKRGGGWTRVTLEEVDGGASGPSVDVISVDRALDRLNAEDPAKANVVELRYFGGLSVDETAAVMGCSASTVARHWRMAKAWLYRELQGIDTDGV